MVLVLQHPVGLGPGSLGTRTGTTWEDGQAMVAQPSWWACGSSGPGPSPASVGEGGRKAGISEALEEHGQQGAAAWDPADMQDTSLR